VANLTTRTLVKAALKIPAGVTMHDGYIDGILGAVDEEVKSVLGLPGLTQTWYTQRFDVERPTDELRLRYTPVGTVAGLTNDGSLVAGTDYYVDDVSGILRLISGSFAYGRQKVVVTYQGGWSTVPSDVTHLATLIAAMHANTDPHSGIESESVEGYDYTIGAGSKLPPNLSAIAAQHRRLMAR
jgi:hypothetical protein